MMKLYLVQHGLALSSAEDALRPLSKEGREAVLKIGRWAQQTKLSVDAIHHSGKLRAEQTATIMAESLLPNLGIHSMSGLGPNDDVTVMEQYLANESDNIMLVGHLPFLNRLASLLLTANAESEIIQFHNAAIVCLQCRKESEGSSQSPNWSRVWTLDWVMLAEHAT